MSQAATITSYAVAALLVPISVYVGIDWLHSRSRAQGFLALSISCLAATATVGAAITAVGDAYSLLTDASILLFLTSGYALVRFRGVVAGLSRGAHGLLIAGLAVVGGAALLARLPAASADGRRPPYSAAQAAAVLAVLVAWCLCVTEPAVRTWISARPLPMVPRSRLRALGYGYVTMVMLLVLAVATGGLSGGGRQAPQAQVMAEILCVISVLLLWTGFAPPQELRLWWRRGDAREEEGMHQLLLYSSGREALAGGALEWAVRLVGGSSGSILDGQGAVLATLGKDAPAERHPGTGAVTKLTITELAGDGGAAGGGPHCVVTVPLPFRSGTGILTVTASPLTPLFAQEEVRRLHAYAAAVVTAMDRVQLNAELQASESRFRSAFEDAPVGVCLISLGGRFLRVNPAMVTLTGYSEDTLLDMEYSALTHPDDVDVSMLNFQRLVAGSVRAYQIEKRYVRADGAPLWVVAAASLVRGRDGTPLHVVGFVKDITDRHQAEESVAMARAEADQASRAKSEFLSRMSHELRTPLNAVLGFAELMEMDELSATHRQYVTTILRAGTHLLQLINDVLDISRIEAGRLSMSLEPVALGPLLDECIELVRPMGGARRIVLPVDIPAASGVHVFADKQRAKQVLLNIFANAVKYNRDGGSVTVAIHRGDQRTRVEITDTGDGIAGENLARLFAPFERLDKDRSGVDGTGLGLTLSRRLAEEMGGTVDVRSVVGQGTTFGFELQSASPPELAVDMAAESVAAAPTAEAAGRRTVLYIEDTLSNLRLMEGIIAARPQYDLLPAMQGRLGLELARQHLPALILLDLHLPDVSGEDILRILKADPHTSHIPVVVISADATPRQIRRLQHLGAHTYITKPLHVREVLGVLDGQATAEAMANTAVADGVATEDAPLPVADPGEAPAG